MNNVYYESPTMTISEEIDKMKDAARDTAQQYARRMVDHIDFNPTLYPEYLTNNNEEIPPQKDIRFGGWHI